MNGLIFKFVGDISLNGAYDKLIKEKGANFPFEKIKNSLEDADLVVGNLESPFCSENMAPAFPMKTPLSADANYAEALKWAGFNVLNLSNNHILDYGEKAVAETMSSLCKQEITHFGYGSDLPSAKKMETIAINSIKIGFIGYTDVVIDSPFFAGPNTRGVAKFDVDGAVNDTIENKQSVDLLVINLHWGVEYFHLPTPTQIINARKLIDAGADIIIGHHPHVLQGIEKYKNGIIAYSLGNFIFSEILWKWENAEGENRITKYPLTRNNRRSIILKVDLKNKTEFDYEVIGTFIKKNGQVQKKPYIAKRIRYLSQILKVKEYEKYFYQEFAKFQKWALIKNQLQRVLKFYKIRPKHFKEIAKFFR